MNPFKIVLEEYPKEKLINPTAKHNKETSLYIALFNKIPSLIDDWIKDSGFIPSEFTHDSSIGQGQLAEIPWVACFNKNVTLQASSGYYIVFLFSAEHSFFYLNLAQSVTNNNDGSTKTKADLNNMILYAKVAKEYISSSNDINESFGPVNLKTKKSNSIGQKYGQGTIKGYKYNLSDILNCGFTEIIKKQFLALLNDYNKLIEICGNDLHKLSPSSDTLYQSLIQSPELQDNLDILSAPEKKDILSKKYPRNPNVSKKALLNSKYQCEFDENHKTFITIHGKNYVEGHHFIPLSYQNEFLNSLDIEQNIIALCPTCHRAIHHSDPSHKNKMLDFFYKKRASELINKGLKITLPKLRKYYKNSEVEE